MRFVSPGVYTKEVDISGYSISKNQIRRGKICRLLGIKNTNPIVGMPHGCTSGFILSNTYEEFKNT